MPGEKSELKKTSFNITRMRREENGWAEKKEGNHWVGRIYDAGDVFVHQSQHNLKRE